jgi:Flp pilus assembly protein TadD
VSETEKLFTKGVEAIKNGNMVSALVFFEKVTQLDKNPRNRSYLAFCIARERGQFKKAISLCEEALKEEPKNPVHYLNLGRIYILNGQKTEGMRLLREGLTHEENREIIDELIELGMRKPPVIPSLNRQSPLNKYLGIVLTRLGLR